MLLAKTHFCLFLSSASEPQALEEPLTLRAMKGDLADDAHKTLHHPSNEAVVTEDLRKRALSSVRLSYKELSEEGEGNSNSIFMLLESVDKVR